jgi:hypothetical protein
MERVKVQPIPEEEWRR